MARTTRSKAAAVAPEAVTAEAPADVTTSTVSTNTTETQPEPVKEEEPKDGSGTKSKQRRANRRNQYKKARRRQGVEELHNSLGAAAGGKPMTRKERYALRVQTYQPQRQRAKATSRKVSELEDLVKKQREQIRELRRLAAGSTPRLQPPASPPPAEVGEEPDSSPAKIRDQLLTDASRSPGGGGGGGGGGGEGQTVVEVEEVVTRPAGEPMEGVQQTTVVTSVEQDVDYPALPSVEDTMQLVGEHSGEEEVNGAGDDKQESQPEAADEGTHDSAAATPAPRLAADTPIKSMEEVRDSSAEDSNAGTPRNVRRSPRKKAKRRSFAGHSYAG